MSFFNIFLTQLESQSDIKIKTVYKEYLQDLRKVFTENFPQDYLDDEALALIGNFVQSPQISKYSPQALWWANQVENILYILSLHEQFDQTDENDDEELSILEEDILYFWLESPYGEIFKAMITQSDAEDEDEEENEEENILEKSSEIIELLISQTLAYYILNFVESIDLSDSPLLFFPFTEHGDTDGNGDCESTIYLSSFKRKLIIPEGLSTPYKMIKKHHQTISLELQDGRTENFTTQELLNNFALKNLSLITIRQTPQINNFLDFLKIFLVQDPSFSQFFSSLVDTIVANQFDTADELMESINFNDLFLPDPSFNLVPKLLHLTLTSSTDSEVANSSQLIAINWANFVSQLYRHWNNQQVFLGEWLTEDDDLLENQSFNIEELSEAVEDFIPTAFLYLMTTKAKDILAEQSQKNPSAYLTVLKQAFDSILVVTKEPLSNLKEDLKLQQHVGKCFSSEVSFKIYQQIILLIEK